MAKVERVSPENVVMAGGTDADIRRFIESDFKIRSGLCPNGCGLMDEYPHGQDCARCGFTCNVFPDKGQLQ